MKKMNKGVIPINKPAGWTSFDVVNKVKHLLKFKKVGHLGTLDPMATGVLLVTVGKATKLFNLMQEKQKSYIATFKFGVLTDTLDATGKEIDRSSNIPTQQEIAAVIKQFKGKIMQIPPKYSAKSINGERAYKLARQNKEFSLPAKEVEIYDLQIVTYNKGVLKLNIVCGSGTYIRALGRDIALSLNTFACMTELVRTTVDKFKLDSCVSINSLTSENIANYILPIKEILNYSILNLPKDKQDKLLNGQTIKIVKPDGDYLLVDELDAVAIVRICNNLAKMIMFLG